MTTNISAQGLVAIYEALGAELPEGNIAVKISTGESGSNYLRPELIGDLVQAVNGTIVECNTAYGGQRANTAYHRQVAEDHGYTAIADVDIMDADGSMALPVTSGTHLTENYVGVTMWKTTTIFVVLSHFKGHAMAGFGGAIKNTSIGIASSDGKAHIHSGRNRRQHVGRRPGRFSRIHGGGGQVGERLHGRTDAVYQRHEPAFGGL